MCQRAIGVSLTLAEQWHKFHAFTELCILKLGDYLQMLLNVCSSCKQLPAQLVDTPYKADMYIHHKEFPKQFTDAPYKAGIGVHCTKDYQGT